MLLFLPYSAGKFTNYNTAVDYARKEERVIRPSSVVRDPWVVFPLRRVLAMLMTAAEEERAGGRRSERLFKRPDLATSNKAGQEEGI